MAVARNYLYLTAALIWGIPGVLITIKGVTAYSLVLPSQLWWLLAITASMTVGFFFIFRSITRRYIERIATLPAKSPLWQTFPPKGWLLLVFMMGIGMTLKLIPAVPIQFTASFYSALGPMLMLASLRFLTTILHR